MFLQKRRQFHTSLLYFQPDDGPRGNCERIETICFDWRGRHTKGKLFLLRTGTSPGFYVLLFTIELIKF